MIKILVSGVLQDGPADKAGLKPGDVIVSLDHQPIQGSQQMLKTIAGKAPGSPMSVSVYRDDAEAEQVAIVGERPPISERR